MLSDSEILSIVGAEEDAAIDEQDSIAGKRETLIDYYNQRPFGDEVEGQSQGKTEIEQSRLK